MQVQSAKANGGETAVVSQLERDTGPENDDSYERRRREPEIKIRNRLALAPTRCLFVGKRFLVCFSARNRLPALLGFLRLQGYF